jgi:hypothetical protein
VFLNRLRPGVVSHGYFVVVVVDMPMPGKNYPDATPTSPFSVQQRLEVLRMIRSRLPNHPARVAWAYSIVDKLTDARNVSVHTTRARCRGCVFFQRATGGYSAVLQRLERSGATPQPPYERGAVVSSVLYTWFRKFIRG